MNQALQKLPTDGRATVAIIGGGFSGAAVAFHLHQLAPGRARILVIEPRAELVRGVAYSAEDSSHRINVPAARMSLVPDDPEHFARWLAATRAMESDPDARMPDGRDFPARHVFGDYVASAINELAPNITHLRGLALSIEKHGSRTLIVTTAGQVQADIVVLAVCHPPPSAPGIMADDIRNHPGFVGNPWLADAFAKIDSDARILIVGTGLTMADIVASLDRQRHRGEILAISRRGLRSRGHPVGLSDPFGDFITEPIRDTTTLLRRIRQEIELAAQEGRTWHSVLDQLRSQGTAIWQTLPLDERRRLLRHLRPFWDVHRFRIAPQVEAIFDRKLSDGSLHVRQASLVSIGANAQRLLVTMRNRRVRKTEAVPFDAVVLATGPAHGRVFDDDPLLASLHRAGLARPDPLHLGIDVDGNGRAIRTNGDANADIFVAGPLARGTFGELMGLPDVAVYAARIAGEVAGRLTQIDVSRRRV
jgi:uncharacterized NAD(P)/FAD-binding protein YdhS